ncbi:MAG: hypothetical protein F6K26_43720 [Moorea sp. SIO2I5]|nr:hypothetical protein [Moorena sp. SIO2I5]
MFVNPLKPAQTDFEITDASPPMRIDLWSRYANNLLTQAVQVVRPDKE